MPFIKNLALFARKIIPVTALPIVDAGQVHNILIKGDGRAWAWGVNTDGRIGDNTVQNRVTPVSVAGTVKTFCKISAGESHTLAIDKNGRAWAWGNRQNGAVGDGGVLGGFPTSRCTPVSVAGATRTFCEISAGYRFSLAIDKNGRAWGWGTGDQGQLGNSSISCFTTPVSIAGAVKTFCKIQAGFNYGVAIDKNGRAWAWGGNGQSQLGNNSTNSTFSPVSVLGATKTFCQIAASIDISTPHTMAIDKNGRVWAWGNGWYGQLGDNGLVVRATPVSVAGAIKTFCKISAGTAFSVAIDKNGRAWAWGYNNIGQLGDNTLVNKSTPVSVLGNTKTFCEISAGGCSAGSNSYTIAIEKNGNVWGWGSGLNGVLGDGQLASRLTPVSILGATKTFCHIVVGNGNTSGHNIALDKNGRAWGWGFNSQRQLGTNDTATKATPVSVLGAVKTFCKIATGEWHSMGIDKNGRVWGWGTNAWGAIGNNSTNSANTPVSILGATKTFCEIAAGQYFTLALDKNGRAWAWGRNVYGELGDGSLLSRLTPVSVIGNIKTFCKITANGQFSNAIDRTGLVWSWGFNSVGQLGDNSTISKTTPVSVGGSRKTFCKISAGGAHVIAIDKNGRVWGWGSNGNGQIGDNSITQRNTPVSILGATKTFCEIGTGSNTTVAIDKNGRVWAWGSNTGGMLGDNTLISKRTPVSVAGAVKTFCKIVAGVNHTVAIDKNGRVWAWGSDASGQLGQNTGIRMTPVRVCVL